MDNAAGKTTELFFGNDSLKLDTVLAMAATFLALAVAVQVLQEVYKYFTTSKARAYRIALKAWLGEGVDGIDPSKMRPFLVQGPFTFLAFMTLKSFKERTPAHLLPMKKEEMIRALEESQPASKGKAIKVLQHEATRQAGTPGEASPMLGEWIQELWSKYNTDGSAREIFEFLGRWGLVEKPKPGGQDTAAKLKEPKGPVDAPKLLEDFYQQFLPLRERIKRQYEQFSTNFEYAYQRRNLRQTFVISFLLVLVFNLGFEDLYRRAASMSPEEVRKLVESARALESMEGNAPSPPQGGEGGDVGPPGPGVGGGGAAPGSSPKKPGGQGTASTPSLEPGTKGKSAPVTADVGKGGEASTPEKSANTSGAPGATGAPSPGVNAEATPVPPGGESKSGKQAGSTGKPVAAEPAAGEPGTSTPPTALQGKGKEASGATAPDEAGNLKAQQERLHHAITAALGTPDDKSSLFSRGWKQINHDLEAKGTRDFRIHLVNCLLTAIFVTFGAPFWNGILDSLMSKKTPAKETPAAPRKETV